MHTLTLLQEHYFWILVLSVGIVGLCVGSFLNVLIYRMPRMLFQDWYQQAKQLMTTCPNKPDLHAPSFRIHRILDMDEKPEDASSESTLSLALPCSHCPHCRHPLKWWHNIPLISFIFLKAQCAFCKQSISWRYPLVELLASILGMVVIIQLGFNGIGFAGLIFTWLLIAMTGIDFDHQILPDDLTLLLLWLGLITNLFNVFTTLDTAIIGVVVGYVSLWLVARLFYLVTKREGMGYGDFKLVAAFGAWFGWPMLIPLILIASLIGAIVGISVHVINKHEKSIPLAFGPYLAISGWICLCFGPQLIFWYLQLVVPG